MPTILVPLDGTPEAAAALPPAQTLARATGARVFLLQVVRPLPAFVDVGDGWLGASVGVDADPAWHEEARRAAQTYVDRLAERLRRAGVAAEGRTAAGEVVPTIEVIADEVDADLVVLSTHALTGPARALLGSVADAVVRGARRPVLLVRRDAPAGQTIDGEPAVRAAIPDRKDAAPVPTSPE